VPDARSIRAIIFDVDGTLYRHGPVRRAMAVRLAGHLLGSPRAGRRTVAILRAYRHAQERLRAMPDLPGDDAQLLAACDEVGCAPAWARAAVEDWMDRRPLDLVRRHMRPDLPRLLAQARAAGLRLGVFSDYPAEAKLRAMGLDGAFDAIRSANMPDVRAFKPNPRGLIVTAAALGVPSSEVLYVGDRPAVDAAAARRAGMQAAIVDIATTEAVDVICVPRLADLAITLGLNVSPAPPRSGAPAAGV
jgi:FMN phosphatase YigB (HAD superfamily)